MASSRLRFRNKNSLFFQVTPVDRLTAKTVVTERGDPVVFPAHPAFPGLPVPPVWTVTVSRHSASCPWWRRRFLRRTPAWRAPVRCEEGPERKTERLEEKPELHLGFCHLVCLSFFLIGPLIWKVILFSWSHLCGYKLTWRWTLNSTPRLWNSFT